jgi:cell cycle checkpoint protein
LTKALTRVLDMAILKPQTPPPRSAVQLIAMTANGDLRSAINSLQLLCAGGLKGTSNKRKRKEEVATGKKKGLGSRGGKGAKLDVSQDLRAV